MLESILRKVKSGITTKSSGRGSHVSRIKIGSSLSANKIARCTKHAPYPYVGIQARTLARAKGVLREEQ
jgi:hypothetical protein